MAWPCVCTRKKSLPLNHRCSHVLNGRRCYGWDQCESCEATGKVGTQACSACAGFGWIMYG